MLNNNILNHEVQQFISTHIGSDLQKLALKGSTFDGVEASELLEQIQSKLKCKRKLPNWFKTNGIYFPSKLNIEQSSSEKTSKYKSQLISGDSLIDLTGGFGVDSYYFSKQFKSVVHCEINAKLSEIVKHNFNVLKVKNIDILTGDGLKILQQSDQNFDWIYLDPSRRDAKLNKRFFVSDCIPDVSVHLDLFFKYSKNILIKMSPMLDIQAALNILPNTKSIYVVAVKNEVKELLFTLEENYSGEPILNAINLSSNQPPFHFLKSEEQQCSLALKKPLQYLYEPNAAVLKAGAFKIISEKFGLSKLDQHTHLYTSDNLIYEFPGKLYKIKSVLNYHKKELKRQFYGFKATIKTRHFPKSIETLKKEFNIKSGGDDILLFTSIKKNKIVLFLEQINLNNN